MFSAGTFDPDRVMMYVRFFSLSCSAKAEHPVPDAEDDRRTVRENQLSAYSIVRSRGR
jgi:hypothetical protein